MADNSFNRYDFVVLDFNQADRVNTIKIVEGDASLSIAPDLIETDDHIQIPLALIKVWANATQINPADITNYVGVTESTPFATGLMQQATLSELLTQWDAEFNAWMTDMEDDIQELNTTGTLEELADIRMRQGFRRNLIINGDMRVNQSQVSSTTGITKDTTDYRAVADRWRLRCEGTGSGTWYANRYSLGDGRYGYRSSVSASGTMSGSLSSVYFYQVIEQSMLGELYKGTSKAKPLVASFSFKTNKTGTYILELKDVRNNRTVARSFYHSGNGSYANYVLYFDSLDTEGQFNLASTDAGLEMRFWLAAGSGYTSGLELGVEWGPTLNNIRAVGQANLASTVGNYAEITNVQLEVGTLVTDFERIPYRDELALCQRYYEVHPLWTAFGMVNTIWCDYDEPTKWLYLQPKPWQEPKRVNPDCKMSSGQAYNWVSTPIPLVKTASNLTESTSDMWNVAGAIDPTWQTPETEGTVYSNLILRFNAETLAYGVTYNVSIWGLQAYADYY